MKWLYRPKESDRIPRSGESFRVYGEEALFNYFPRVYESHHYGDLLVKSPSGDIMGLEVQNLIKDHLTFQVMGIPPGQPLNRVPLTSEIDDTTQIADARLRERVEIALNACASFLVNYRPTDDETLKRQIIDQF
jgi:hypothetical protein